eukprot:365482-Chlamydomonas_euryale.AAC.18
MREKRGGAVLVAWSLEQTMRACVKTYVCGEGGTEGKRRGEGGKGGIKGTVEEGHLHHFCWRVGWGGVGLGGECDEGFWPWSAKRESSLGEQRGNTALECKEGIRPCRAVAVRPAGARKW